MNKHRNTDILVKFDNLCSVRASVSRYFSASRATRAVYRVLVKQNQYGRCTRKVKISKSIYSLSLSLYVCVCVLCVFFPFSFSSLGIPCLVGLCLCIACLHLLSHTCSISRLFFFSFVRSFVRSGGRVQNPSLVVWASQWRVLNVRLKATRLLDPLCGFSSNFLSDPCNVFR